MAEKVLGFYEKDSDYIKCIGLSDTIEVSPRKLVPVVLVKEHRKEIEKLRKHLDAVVAFRDKDFVSVEWLEKWCKEHQHRHIDRFLDELPPSVFTRGLLKAVRLQAKPKEAKKKNG